jgi:glycine cleavage system H protein
VDAPRADAARRFSPDHVWVDEDGFVGVTELLVRGVPEPRRVHLPAVGQTLAIATPFGALEGDKGLLDLYAPCDGVVVAVNDAIVAAPSMLIDAPTSWLVRIAGTPGPLLDEAAYRARARPPLRRGKT